MKLKNETNKEVVMGHGYLSYALAVRKRRRDEMTIFDRRTRRFYNVKVHIRRRRWSGF